MAKNEILNINLKPQDKKKIIMLADAAGMNVSEYIVSKLLSDDSENKSHILSKYEDDLLTHTLNNTILIRYLVDKIGDVQTIEKAKESVNKWIDTHYKDSK